MGQNYFPPDPEDVVEEAIATKVAVLAVGGKTFTQIAKELSIPTSRAKKILASDECLRRVREIETEVMQSAKARIRSGVGRLAGEVVRVLEKHLKENNLQAVAPALKILGFSDQEVAQTDQKLVIVMPGTDTKPVVNVTPKED